MDLNEFLEDIEGVTEAHGGGGNWAGQTEVLPGLKGTWA